MRLFYYALSSRQPDRRRRLAALLIGAAVAAVLTVAGCGSGTGSDGSAAGQSGQAGPAAERQAAANPDLDPGSSLSGIPAPDFTLTNQFGQRMSLSAFRGKVVILAFTDSECTTVCPLTTESMLAARQLLGTAGRQVQLIGIDANPAATSISDVMSYSRAHGMVNQWDFLTGSDAELAKVWKDYDIYVQIEKGNVDHTPAVFIIDTRGRERKLYMTTMAYASITQAAQIMAQESSALLPGRPSLASIQSLAYISGLTPATTVTLPAVSPGAASSGSASSGSVTLGPGKAHLVMFFATWLSETSDLKARLLGLSQYARAAPGAGLPGLVAVDEEATEPSAQTVSSFLASIGRPLSYPVALDRDGRLADGYGVQDQPWFVLTSAAGKILWKHDGWLSASQLTTDVRSAAR